MKKGKIESLHDATLRRIEIDPGQVKIEFGLESGGLRQLFFDGVFYIWATALSRQNVVFESEILEGKQALESLKGLLMDIEMTEEERRGAEEGFVLGRLKLFALYPSVGVFLVIIFETEGETKHGIGI